MCSGIGEYQCTPGGEITCEGHVSPAVGLNLGCQAWGWGLHPELSGWLLLTWKWRDENSAQTWDTYVTSTKMVFHYRSHLLFLCCPFWDRVGLCSSGWLGTYYVAQASSNLQQFSCLSVTNLGSTDTGHHTRFSNLLHNRNNKKTFNFSTVRQSTIHQLDCMLDNKASLSKFKSTEIIDYTLRS